MKLPFPSYNINSNDFSNSAVRFTMLGVFLLNIIIKGVFLGEPPFGMDEPFTLFRAQKDYLELINDLAKNNHPPFFESIMWVWLRIVGYKVVLLRLVPLVFSSLAAAMLFKLGQRYFSFFAGLLAALLFTFSRMHIYFSHEIRSYPLLALLSIVSIYIYLKRNNQNDGESSNSWWWSLALVNLLLLYTHYFSVFLIAAQGIHVLFLAEHKSTRTAFIKASVLAAIGYSPHILLVFSRWSDKVQNGHWLNVPGADALFNQLSNFLNVPTLSFIALLVLLSGFYFVRKDSYSQRGLKLLLILFPGVFVLMWGLSQWLPIFHDRYLSFTTIGLFMMLAVVIDNFPKMIKTWAGVAIVIAMAATTEYIPITNQEMEKVVETLNAEREEGDHVILYPQWGAQCFSFHYNLEYFKDYEKLDTRLKTDRIHLSYHMSPERIKSEAAKTSKLIVVNYEGGAPGFDMTTLQGGTPKTSRIIAFDRHAILIIEDAKP